MKKLFTTLVALALLPWGLSAQVVTSFDGVRIAFSDTGHGDTTLVFVHGWACDRTYWAAQAPLAASYRLVAIDLAGYGQSGADRTQWSMQAFGRDIAAVIDALQLRRVVLVGHSAGALAALEGARLRPRQVIGVVGADGFRGMRGDYFERTFTDDQIEASCCASLRTAAYADSLAASVRQSFFLPSSRVSLVDSVARQMASVPSAVTIPASRAYMVYRAHHLATALAEVGSRVPIVAINAERSQIDSTLVQSLAPRFHVAYMAGVGHFVMMEDPGGFNRELRRAIAVIASP